MLAANVQIKELTEFHEFDETIEAIENDWHNTVGGWTAWTSGKNTYLTEAAKNKIKQLQAKQDRLFPVVDEEEL